MSIKKIPHFHNHPAEVKEQYDKLNKLQQLKQLTRLNRLEITAFKPVTVKYHRIHWETLDEENDTILVTLQGGETLSVSYITMVIVS